MEGEKLQELSFVAGGISSHVGRKLGGFPTAKLFTLGSNNCASRVYTTASKKEVQMKTSTQVRTAALFIVAETMEKLGYPLEDGCLSKLGYTQEKGSRTCFFGMRIVLS